MPVAIATITSKGQITIPARVRQALGLEAGDRVEFVEQAKGQFAIVAATHSVQELKGLFQRKQGKPVSIEEMNAAIARRASGSR
jgi:antitoxin PrlF